MRRRRTLPLVAALVVASTLTVSPARSTFPGDNGRIAWSRDGDIWTMRADGSDKVQLTDTMRFETAVWSPSGRRLAVIQWPGAPDQRTRILVMRADGTHARVVAKARFTVQGLAWSPGGRRLVYCELDTTHSTQPAPYPSVIRVVDVVTATQQTLTERSQRACAPTWSPTGARIAFVAGNVEDTDVYVMRRDGSHVRAVLTDPRRQLEVAWRPASRRIAVTTAVPGTNADVSQFVESVRADGTGRRQLTDPAASYDHLPQWSPDGESLLYFRIRASDLSVRLGVVQADGTGEHSLGLVEPGDAVWSPDSRWIVYALNGNVYRTSPAAGHPPVRLAGDPAVLDSSVTWQALP